MALIAEVTSWSEVTGSTTTTLSTFQREENTRRRVSLHISAWLLREASRNGCRALLFTLNLLNHTATAGSSQVALW